MALVRIELPGNRKRHVIPHKWFYWLAASIGHSLDDGTADYPMRIEDAAFDSFVQQYERQILNYLWRMIGDEDAAYDLTQEAFLRAWTHFSRVRNYAEPRAWLFRVATNLALNYRQQRATASKKLSPLDEEKDLSASDPGRTIVENDLVHEVLLALPAKRRAALVLREVYGLSAEEIGQIMGISRDAMKMLLSRTREQFRNLYIARGQEQ
jgi:RNA polymerase sigma-70 factor, ECF subfamily